MSKRSAKEDEVQAAHRGMQEVARRHEDWLPADVELAWETWIAGVAKIDERTRTLLRAAFEAGAEAARTTSK